MNIDKRIILDELRLLVKNTPHLADGACTLAVLVLAASGEMDVFKATKIVVDVRMEACERA